MENQRTAAAEFGKCTETASIEAERSKTQINSRPGSKFANTPCGWSTFGGLESSGGRRSKELSLLCLGEIEIGLA